GNPFTAERVTRAGPVPCDVPSIHAASFERLIALAQEAHADNAGIGVILWGEPGTGKSHLLRRVEQWSAHDRRAIFASPYALHVDPAELPRAILRNVVSVLTGCEPARWDKTLLFRIFNGFLVPQLKRHNLMRGTWPQAARAYESALATFVREVPGATPHDPLFRVLFRYFKSGVWLRQRREDDGAAALALRWLGGDEMDSDEAEALDLRPREAQLAS